MTAQREQPWTVIGVLGWTAERFARAALDSPRLDAEVLLAHCLGVDRLRLYLDHDKPLAAEELAGYRVAIRRRLAGEPVAHITGRREFWSLELEVSADVLTPRPETELLVEVARDHLRAAAAPPGAVVDVGTGSGAIAVALAKELPQRRVCATEISPAALAVARRNAARHEAAVELFAGDLLAPLPGDVRCAAIVANLPYIPSAELPTLMLEVSRHEPRLALDGGPDGLDLVRRLVPAAASRLSAGGLLALEIAPEQREAVVQLAAQCGMQPTVHRDLGGLERVIAAVKV